MSEFDEALAQAVEADTARGRLPGAADAVRRGHKRSLRARGGVAVLSVAAVGGAFATTTALGGAASGEKTVAAAATTGNPAGAPKSTPESAAQNHTGDGVLPAEQWPGYNLVHWQVKQMEMPTPPTKWMSLQNFPCDGGVDGLEKYSVPVTDVEMWGGSYSGSTSGKGLGADETVITFADSAKAEAYLEDARGAGSAKACGTGPTAPVPSPGVSTEHGVSWVVREQDTVVEGSHMPSVSHSYLVQDGNRVAVLRVMQWSDDLRSTAQDAKVLNELEQALKK